jgi:hypothetical protein
MGQGGEVRRHEARVAEAIAAGLSNMTQQGYQLLADIVAKVENRWAIIFSPKDDVTGDRQSLYSQSRYQGRQ